MAQPIPPALGLHETVLAKNQPEYLPLPAVLLKGLDGLLVTRWKFTWRERLHVLLRGDAFLTVMTFGNPLQPLRLEASKPMEITSE
jgi:hypothetical protein